MYRNGDLQPQTGSGEVKLSKSLVNNLWGAMLGIERGKDCEDPIWMTEDENGSQGQYFSPDWPVGTNLRKLYTKSQISKTTQCG